MKTNQRRSRRKRSQRNQLKKILQIPQINQLVVLDRLPCQVNYCLPSESAWPWFELVLWFFNIKISDKSHRHSLYSAFPDISSNQQDHFGEMELPWSATLPISPALRSQWQSLLDKNDVIGAVNLFPTIWNSLRVSCSWIVNNQLPKKNKGLNHMTHTLWLIHYESYHI